MNFMAKSSNQGFYGECQNQNMMSTNTSSRGKHPFPSSSSSSSTQQHKSLVSLAFHHHHQQQQWGSWSENKFEPPQPSPEEITSLRCYTGGAEKLELMDASAAAAGNNDGDDDPTVVAAANPENDVRRGEPSSDGLRLRVGRGSTVGTSTDSVVVEREHLFDKVVTPSDVGKLNRLVIPKQHAEKYFPLDSSTNEKGLLLNFEDRNGKPWRFRYSYWNSSQSYVMTKGWSRFVKDKKLDAGDIVSFHRGVGELGKDRLFIDWRRRPNAPELPPSLPTLSQLPQHYFSFHRSTHTWSPLFTQPQASPATWDHSHFPQPNPTNYQPNSSSYGYSYGSGGPYGYNSVVNPCSSSVIYLGSAAAAAAAAPQWAGMVQVQSGRSGGAVEPMPMVFESVSVVHGKAAAKRLRLFGVNMDCPISVSDDCDMLSTATIPHSTMVPQPPHLSSSPIPPLQLRIYNGSPLAATQSELLDKGNPSSKPFDLDI